MAIAHVQTATQVQVDASSATSFNLTMTGTVGGNALTVFHAVFDNNTTWTVSSVSDSGNSWTTREGITTASQRVRGIISHAINITGGSRTITIALSGTAAGANRYLTYGGIEWSGVTAEDTWDANSEVDMTSTDASAGPITTTDAGALLVGIAVVTSSDPTMNFASPASWTNRYRENDNSNHQGYDVGSWLPGSIQTTYTPQWSHDNAGSHFCAGLVVAFRAGRASKNTRSQPLGTEIGMNWRGNL